MTDIASYDWLIDYSTTGADGNAGEILHAPTADQTVLFDDWDGDSVTGDVLCGQRGEWTIPGIGSRMSLDRCPDCCDRLGYPHGVGSPKNDRTIRALEEWA